ncbi:1-deoxy-D-xylulose-5-phosphate reductoisomerase [Candidatus Nanopelagicales bacterium]|nr:1-deoxy-D-xylulose-5-phosphate reductoisomerase [Candidatus Nanopelagicales bacterium]
MRRVIILGSTGSIGTQALDVIRRNPDRFDVVGLAASGSRMQLLSEQVAEFRPSVVAISSGSASDLAVDGPMPGVMVGPRALVDIAGVECDVVVNGMAGAVGLEPTLAALQAGSVVALANKESLIIGGDLVRGIAGPDQIVPVDSEHSALAQCLRSGTRAEVRRLILTASGGPFRGWSASELESVTPSQALAHPTWDMGPLVTINSATLMNKGLEVIEAHLLFDFSFTEISVVVHPQSIVHSMVEYVDGSTIAQVSPPDMRLPIALSLDWPRRIVDAAPANRWDSPTSWDFYPLDEAAFPAVGLARRAGSAGGTAPAVLNGANEVCVDAFLNGRLPFTGIVSTVSAIVEEHLNSGWISGETVTLEDVLTADAWARERVVALLAAG